MSAGPQKSLSLFDSTCIIVGIIIGAGIYETSPTVAACMGGWGTTLAVWLAGGLLALCGALCYAELATTYPHEGGDYVYLNEAYGPCAGFIFGWSQLAIIRPCDIALMAFVFARYAATLHMPFPHVTVVYAAAAVVLLTTINILGVRESKWTQNALTVIKVLGLMFVIVGGLFAPGTKAMHPSADLPGGGLQLAMILVLFTYGGWNEMAYVAAEIKKPEQNILHALVLGTVAVTVLYLLVNVAFMHALGHAGVAASPAVAVDAIARVLPSSAGKVIAIIICISALGAVNGQIFTGARISYALGAGHPVFRTLGKWNLRLGTPIGALVLQGVLSLGIVLTARSFIETLVYSAPVVWIFFLATSIALFRLRKKDRHLSRPCSVLGYPFTPAVFFMVCAFMFYSSSSYALKEKPVGFVAVVALLLSGGILYHLFTNKKAPA
jgi:amino acid transporter